MADLNNWENGRSIHAVQISTKHAKTCIQNRNDIKHLFCISFWKLWSSPAFIPHVWYSILQLLYALDWICSHYEMVSVPHETIEFSYNSLSDSRIWSIRGQMHDWRHHYKVFPSAFWNGGTLFSEWRQGTKKSCRGIEQVREAGRSKKKPFLF